MMHSNTYEEPSEDVLDLPYRIIYYRRPKRSSEWSNSFGFR
jgi:hypothetical protein